LATNGDTPIELATSPAPYAAVADGKNVYWTDEVNGTVTKVPVDGGVVSVVAMNQSRPTEMAIDSSNIYWIDAAADGAIMKLAR
jgi:hypothetical protein